MKRKPLYIKLIVLLVLLVVIGNQIIWVVNMYNNYKDSLQVYSTQSLQYAVPSELAERNEAGGGFLAYSASVRNPNPNDTSRYFTKRVQSVDSTYYVQVDKYDPYTNFKILQYIFKNKYPVNIEVLHDIFRNELSRFYPLKQTYVEYLDIENDSVIQNNRPEHFSSSYLCSDTIIMDIKPSIAMLAYVEMPESLILSKMTFQLILSIILILIAGYALVYISRSFVLQWKEEKMRQESINAMTHEFKRPISGALSMLSLVPYYLEKNKLEKVKSYAEGAVLELERLTAYTRQIQLISNNEGGKMQLNITNIQIQPFFENIVEQYADSANPVAINLSIKSERKTFKADFLHISNVINNLIENAVKYSKAPPCISIELSDMDQKLAICVRDQGIGIAKKDLKHIFDKYFRVKQSEIKNTNGFGLGLTYVKAVVDAHNGEITVESEINKGSTFCVYINN